MKIFGYETNKTQRHITNVVDKKKGIGFSIIMRPPTRRLISIDTWLIALKSAENVTNPRRNNLYDLYFQVKLDDDYITGINKRQSAITNLNLQYLINDKPDEKAEEFLKNPIFREFKKEILDTIFWGYSLYEFYYQGQVNPYTEQINTSGEFDYHLIPRKHVSPQRGEILSRTNDATGISYRLPEYAKNLLEFGKEDDLGLLLEIAIPVIYKRNATGDWAQYCELAGNNFKEITIEGTSQTKREQVTEAFNKAGSGGIVSLPPGVKIDTVKGSSASSNELFENFNKIMSDNILRLILGQTGTTADAKGGSFARAKVSLEVEMSVHNNDKTYFLDFMNFKFKEYMPYWGFSNKGVFWFEAETAAKEPGDHWTVNEKRAADGLKSIPEGDAIYLPASDIPALEFEKSSKQKGDVKNIISIINTFHDNKIPEAEQDWIYMIHHIHPPKTEDEMEELHHCILWEKENEKGENYEIKHKKDGKVFQHRLDIDDIQKSPDYVFDHLNNKYPIKIRKIEKEKYAIITKPKKKIKHDDKAIRNID